MKKAGSKEDCTLSSNFYCKFLEEFKESDGNSVWRTTYVEWGAKKKMDEGSSDGVAAERHMWLMMFALGKGFRD